MKHPGSSLKLGSPSGSYKGAPYYIGEPNLELPICKKICGKSPALVVQVAHGTSGIII